MSLVVAMEDIKPGQVKAIGDGTSTPFFRASGDTPDAPSAFVVRYNPGRLSAAHFHIVDQFQILVDGKGKLGRHDVSPYYVHFARAYTPYGPLLADKETGWAFLTLRTRYDPVGQVLTAARDKLKQIPDRHPWQVAKKITFPVPGPGASFHDVAEIKDDQGLFVLSLTMAPDSRTTAPEPSHGDGQYVFVAKGSLMHKDREHKAMTVVFVRPEEDAFQVAAGAHGLQALILNFPQVKPRSMNTPTPSTAVGFRKWQCALCSFTYDEAQGMPEEGIPAGTRWENVPEIWSCPDCSASKADFQMIASL